MSAARLFRTFNRSKVAENELRWRARQIQSRDQFERIVSAAEHPLQVRDKLEPLLRKNLPCCLQVDGRHSLTCPAPVLVKV